MIKKRYELEVNGRVVLRLKPKQDKVRMERKNDYGGWSEPVDLNREHVLELRDVLDEIMRDWFCEKDFKYSVTTSELDTTTFIPATGERFDVGTIDAGDYCLVSGTGEKSSDA